MVENKIKWDHGSISRGDWINLKRIMREHGVETVLEFGSGLSTELFSLEDLDEFVSCDPMAAIVECLESSTAGVLNPISIVHYPVGSPPDPGKEFDLVFVDGPVGDRSKELEVGLCRARKILVCHDWGRGQDKVHIPDCWVSMADIDGAVVKGTKAIHTYVREDYVGGYKGVQPEEGL